MSHILCNTLAVGMMAFIIFDNILSSPFRGTIMAQNDNICTTDDCVQIAHTFQQNMKSEADPCEDFYEFACGRYNGTTNRVGIGSFDEIRQITYGQLQSIITDGNQSSFPPLRMAYEFYQSCILDDTATTVGILPIYQKVSQLGKWPLTQVDKNISWLEVMSESRNLGFFPDYIVSITVLFNPNNNSEILIAIKIPRSYRNLHILVEIEFFKRHFLEYYNRTFTTDSYIDTDKTFTIIPPSLPLPTATLQQGLSDPTGKKYFEFMLLIGVEFEALSSQGYIKPTITRRLEEIEKLFYFEVQLAKISPLTVQSEDLLSLQIMTLEKLKQQYPLIKWSQLLQSILGAGVKLNDTEKTTVLFPKFLVELEHLLKATPERVIINYVIWRVIFYSLNIIFAVEVEPRSKVCTTRTQSCFAEVLGSRYVEKYFHNDTRKGVQELVRQIQGQVKKNLLQSSWMDNKTKENAVDKLDAIVTFVGYADYLLHQDPEMIEEYKNVQINVTDQYDSFLNLSKLLYDQQISRFSDSSQNKVSYSISPASINAFYVPTENTIIIPAAILQNPFYSINRPNYLNFATIGYVTGHELSHAFDNYGSHFDKYGNLKNRWQPETETKYKDRIKCFVDQYGSYYLKEINQYVNGYLTLGENLADNEGIKTAYQAYKSWQSTHEKEQKLPGLNYTPEQLFWISSANTWCAKYTASYLNLMVHADSHAPAMVRVNGQFANQKEFAQDFSCPVNSKMNPQKKCQFW